MQRPSPPSPQPQWGSPWPPSRPPAPPYPSPPGYGPPSHYHPGFTQSGFQPPTGYRPTPRRRRWPWVVAGLVVAAGGVAAGGTAAGWFTTYLLDQQAVQDGVRTILAEHYDLDVSDVRCPATLEMKVGNTFTCSVRLDSGESKPVRIEVTGEDGEYTVDRP